MHPGGSYRSGGDQDRRGDLEGRTVPFRARMAVVQITPFGGVRPAYFPGLASSAIGGSVRR
jgi:hypothetical protein